MKDEDRWSITHLAEEINGSHFSNKIKKERIKKDRSSAGREKFK